MARNLSLDDLRRARRDRVAEIEALPHVVGTGLGVKRRGGMRVARAALIVYVDRKRPDKDLARQARIPHYIVHRRRRIPIDVVPVRPVRLEFGSAPYYLGDGRTKGVVTAFARGGDDHFILGSAHCLKGADGNIFTPSPIGLWDDVAGRYLNVAESLKGFQLPGLGIAGDFGYLDAGVATLSDVEMLARARNASPMRFGPAARIGLSLIAEGPNGRLAGTIEAVEIEVEGMRVDIVVRIENGGTYRGHSGMLWRTRAGLAMAMHGYGTDFSGEEASRISLSTAVRRIAQYLEVELLEHTV